MHFDPNGLYAGANPPAPPPGTRFPAIAELSAAGAAATPSAPLADSDPVPAAGGSPLKVEPVRLPDGALAKIFVVGFGVLALLAARRRPHHFTAALVPMLPLGLMIGGLRSGIFGRKRSDLGEMAHQFGKATEVSRLFTVALGVAAVVGLKRYPHAGTLLMGGATGLLTADAIAHGLINFGA